MVERYLELYALGGYSEADVERIGLEVMESISDWDSRYLDEIRGIAEGSGCCLWQVAALNARTELLLAQTSAMSLAAECSTLVYDRVVEGPTGIQAWDWQEELSDYWHAYSSRGVRHSHVGITEHGVLAKIGLNSAGVGVFLNILTSEADHTSGVPIHVLIAAILDNASTVADAIDIASVAPVCSSSNLTVIDRNSAVAIELSPSGIGIIKPTSNGYLTHTNHYLTPALAEKERKGRFGDDTFDRLALLESRIERYSAPNEPRDLVEFLYSDPGQAHLTCEPSRDAEFGLRWKTLATVVIDPREPVVHVIDGSPIDSRRQPWLRLSPN
jgi:isopenicillin-N N-acyltransferase-like protein